MGAATFRTLWIADPTRFIAPPTTNPALQRAFERRRQLLNRD
ncbi:MAG: hypothetical protein ABTR07_09885 [Candidatus Competibacter denitrificans]